MSHRRIVNLQKNILLMIRAEVRKALGEQSKELRSYYEAYQREFRGGARYSNRSALLKAGLRADIILVGDYHTFSQSQRSALRLLTDLLDTKSLPNLTLGLELIRSDDQAALDAYLAGEMSEANFLKKIDYTTQWGFPWKNFKPLLEFAREKKLAVLALNAQSSDLKERDHHAAEILANYAKNYPRQQVLVLYGDLHLARSHLPQKIKTKLHRLGIKKNLLTIFQNSESLYWRLAARAKEHTIDVLKLGSDRYCIISAAPWVKLQSYLQWAETSRLIDEGEGLSLHDLTAQNLKLLSATLKIPLAKDFDFQTFNIQGFAFLEKHDILRSLSADELRALRTLLETPRTILLNDRTGRSPTVYLPADSINAVGEAASLLLHAATVRRTVLLPFSPPYFYQHVIESLLAYFGSKILNHKRKCDLEDDLRWLCQQPAKKARSKPEYNSRIAASWVLKHCEAQRRFLRRNSQEYMARPLPTIALKSTSSASSLCLEITQRLGFILGEKLYASFASGQIKLSLIQRLYHMKLSSSMHSSVQAKRFYFELVRMLQNSPLSHSSKAEVF